MSDTNPFGSLGGEGGFDLNAMLEQAQQMQAQLVAAQEELAATTVEGSAGGVTVTLTGTGELTGVTVSPGLLRRHRRRLADRPGRPGRGGLPRRQGPGRRPGLAGPRPAGRRRPRRRPATAAHPSCQAASVYEGVLQDLIDELARLPGVGPKGAQRIAFHLLAADPADVRRLADTLVEMKAKAHLLQGLRQRLPGGAVPDLPRPAPRPDPDLRGRGAQGRRGDRADPGVPRPLPRARRRDLAAGGHRSGAAAHPRADDAAGRRRRHRGDPGDRSRTSRATRPPHISADS